MKSPASAFSTTSTPRPPVSASTWSANATDRESITWVTPSRRSRSRFASDPAVAKTSAPQRCASCTAARPTPPAAACTSTRSPAAQPGKVMEAVIRRQEGDGDAGGILRTHRVGYARQECGRHDRLRTQACRRESEDAVTDANSLDGAADLGDDARALNPERRRRSRDTSATRSARHGS